MRSKFRRLVISVSIAAVSLVVFATSAVAGSAPHKY
jgi:hypothetical protein